MPKYLEKVILKLICIKHWKSAKLWNCEGGLGCGAQAHVVHSWLITLTVATHLMTTVTMTIDVF